MHTTKVSRGLEIEVVYRFHLCRI